MTRARISYGILTTQNQGGGVKKQGLPPNIGKNQFNFRLIKRKAYPSKKAAAEAAAEGCPEKVVTISSGTVYTSNAELEIFRGCTKIIGNLDIEGNFQPTISIFDCLREITGFFYIISNDLLTSVSGFGNLESIGLYFYITTNASLTNISGFGNLASIGGEVLIGTNNLLTNISGFGNLASIGGFFYIRQNGTNVTPIANNVVTTVTGFGNLTVPTGIAGNLVVEGISSGKLLGISTSIITNLTAATTGTTTTRYLYTS